MRSGCTRTVVGDVMTRNPHAVCISTTAARFITFHGGGSDTSWSSKAIDWLASSATAMSFGCLAWKTFLSGMLSNH